MKSRVVSRKEKLSIRTAVLSGFIVLAMCIGRPILAQEVYSASNSYASYYLDASGSLYVWGEDEYLQPVTTTTTAQDLVPVKVAFPGGVTRWTSVSAGHFFSMALGNDGNVYAWGSNSNGQLGNGTTTDSNTPVKVQLPTGVTATAIACGHYHGLAVGSDGNVYAWGMNNNGQLGNGTTTDSDVPVKVNLPGGFTPAKLCAGWYYSFALGTDGSLYAWGGNGQGQLGIGSTTNAPQPALVPLPTGVTKWTAIYGGIYFTAAMGDDGNLYEAGVVNVSNNYGELGTGSATASSSTFVKANMPAGVTSWKGIALTGSSVLAIGGDNVLYGWGYGGSGEMGNGTGGSEAAINPVPVKVSMPTGVTAVQVSAGRNHGLALGSDGNIYVWGQGTQGQIGNGIAVASYVPVLIQLNPGVILGVKLQTVVPSQTDPAIETVTGPNIAVYDNDSSVVPQHRLILFFTGTGGVPSGSWSMDSIFATMGYNVITLDYENSVVAASIGDSTDSSAFERYREEIITGAPVSGAVNVDTANSVLNRFDKLMLYLVAHDTTGHWGQFMSNGEPLWSSIIVAGHSQGSGHAAYLGKMFDVSRVLMFSGPQDFMDIYNAPAPWLSSPSATPPTSFFAFLHEQDPYNVNHQEANCMKLMNTTRPAILTNVEPGVAIQGNYRILVTNIPTSNPHGSTITTQFQNVWNYMISEEVPTVPPVPVPVSLHGTAGVPRRTTISWDSASGATEYHLQIATDSAFVDIATDTTVLDTSVQLLTPLASSKKYYWHVSASNSGLLSSYSPVDSFMTGTGILSVSETNGLPKAFDLMQNYPNPFNPSTTIEINLVKSGVMSLKIYNVLGQLVKVVDDGYKAPGTYTYNVNMNPFASGAYFYTLQQGSNFMTKGMLLLK